MSLSNALGERMKTQYETRTRLLVPRRTYTVVRLDGKNFHTYTRGLDRPYDQTLMDDMTGTARFLCDQLGGARFAYTQSDEISVLLTDFGTTRTQAWFDGDVQKIVSVAASMATAWFTARRPGRLAFFDARLFCIPDRDEVANYFVWRQQDAMRNSVSMAAQARFSHRQLHKKSTVEMREMLLREHGVDWDDYDPRFTRGTAVTSHREVSDVKYLDKRTGQTRTVVGVERRVWRAAAPPVFTRDVDYLRRQVPEHPGYHQPG